MANIGKLNVQIGVDLNKFRSEMSQAFKILNSNTTQMKRSLTGLEAGFKSVKVATGLLGGAFVAMGLGQVAKDALITADNFNVLQERIKNATKGTGDYAAVSQQLFEIAKSTGSELQASVEVFQRLALGAKDLGVSNDDILKVVQSVQELGVVSGASTEAMKAGLMQFGQSMSGGIVRAEEFNSIMENIPALGEEIASGFGVSAGQLRKMVLEGRVLSKDVLEIMVEHADQIHADFKEMPNSMQRSFNSLNTSISRLVGNLDRALAVTQSIANVANGLADIIDRNMAAAEIAQNQKNSFASLAFDQKIRFNKERFLPANDPLRTIGFDSKGGIFDKLAAPTKLNFNDPGVKQAVSYFGNMLKPFGDMLGGLNTTTAPKLPIHKFAAPSGGRIGGGSGRTASSAGDYGGLLSLDTNLGFSLDDVALNVAESLNKEYQRLVETYSGLKTAEQERIQNINQMITIGKLQGATEGELFQKLLTLQDLELESIDIRTELNGIDELRLEMLRDIKGDTSELAKRQEVLNDIYKQGGINLQEYQGYMEQLKSQFGPMRDQHKELIESMKHEIQRFGQEFETTLVNLVSGADVSFKDMANSFIQAISRMIIHASIIEPLFGEKGAITGFVGNLIGGLFGGGKASGGSVSAGKSYLVGERGPELFSPGSNGFITPNHQLAMAGGGQGMQPVVVEMTINAVDAPSFARLVATNKGLFEGIALKATQKAYNKTGRYGPLDQAGM